MKTAAGRAALLYHWIYFLFSELITKITFWVLTLSHLYSFQSRVYQKMTDSSFFELN